MNRPDPSDPSEEPPLDPAFEKVRKKMVRLLGISIGIMLVGLMAVLAAIVYRTTFAGPKTPTVVEAGQFRAGTIHLPPGATIVSQAASGDSLTLLARLPDGNQAIFLYDMAQDRMTGRFAIATD